MSLTYSERRLTLPLVKNHTKAFVYHQTEDACISFVKTYNSGRTVGIEVSSFGKSPQFLPSATNNNVEIVRENNNF